MASSATRNNLDLLREMGMCLQRLALAGTRGALARRARQHYRDALDIYPSRCRDVGAARSRRQGCLDRGLEPRWPTPEQKREDAAYEDALLRAAIDSYTPAYRTNPGHYYSGINALTLMHLYRHLTDDTRYDAEMETMAGAVRFAAECEPDPHQVFWAKATLGDLEVLVGTPQTVTDALQGRHREERERLVRPQLQSRSTACF